MSMASGNTSRMQQPLNGQENGEYRIRKTMCVVRVNGTGIITPTTEGNWDNISQHNNGWGRRSLFHCAGTSVHLAGTSTASFARRSCPLTAHPDTAILPCSGGVRLGWSSAATAASSASAATLAHAPPGSGLVLPWTSAATLGCAWLLLFLFIQLDHDAFTRWSRDSGMRSSSSCVLLGWTSAATLDCAWLLLLSSAGWSRALAGASASWAGSLLAGRKSMNLLVLN